jgi:hypothetical protein
VCGLAGSRVNIGGRSLVTTPLRNVPCLHLLPIHPPDHPRRHHGTYIAKIDTHVKGLTGPGILRQISYFSVILQRYLIVKF